MDMALMRSMLLLMFMRILLSCFFTTRLSSSSSNVVKAAASCYVSSPATTFSSRSNNNPPPRIIRKTTPQTPITNTRLDLRMSLSSLSDNRNQMMPTIEQLSSDRFIDQVSYAERIVSHCLMDDVDGDTKEKLEMLKAQLSHSDGIRGFFVTYLTGDGENCPSDRREVPSLLVEAMKSVQDNDDLIRLACMNVIMPSGMITMHTDPELSEQSRLTASRGTRILSCLKSIYSNNGVVQNHCDAINTVATTTTTSSSSSQKEVDDELVRYWTNFFEKWGYQEQQKMDIAKAIQSI